MRIKYLTIFATFTLAFFVLFVSVFRTAAVKYEFPSYKPNPTPFELVTPEDKVDIDYVLAYPGKVLPDSILWPIKAFRDKLWLLVNTNPTREAELNLLFADKRLASSKILFEKGKPELGLPTLTKAEKYLETASNLEKENRADGVDTTELLERLTKSSLMHFYVMEQILDMAPEEAKPVIVQTQNYPRKVYEDARNALLDKGRTPVESPFGWK